MSVLVELKGNRYEVSGYKWKVASKPNLLTRATLLRLNSMQELHGPSGADPDPDLTLATEAEKQLGAKIIKRTGPKPADSFDANQVY